MVILITKNKGKFLFLVKYKSMVKFIRGYKVVFMTFARKNLGFWLRYTVLFKNGGYSGIWFTLFDGDTPKGLVVRHDINKTFINQNHAKINSSIFSFKQLEAYAITNKFKWSLKMKPLFKTVNPMPLLLRIFRRDSKYIMVSPYVIFNGNVVFNDKVYEINEYQGTIGYISSSRYLHHWIWLHCSGFEEDKNGWLDMLIASPDGSKEIMFGSIKVHDKLFYIGRLIGTPFNGKYDMTSFKTSIQIRKNMSAEIEVSARRDKMIIAKYEDPIEGYRYCHNTEIADMMMTIQTNNETKKLTCSGRTFFEYALPQILDKGLPQIEIL